LRFFSARAVCTLHLVFLSIVPSCYLFYPASPNKLLLFFFFFCGLPYKAPFPRSPFFRAFLLPLAVRSGLLVRRTLFSPFTRGVFLPSPEVLCLTSLSPPTRLVCLVSFLTDLSFPRASRSFFESFFSVLPVPWRQFQRFDALALLGSVSLDPPLF